MARTNSRVGVVDKACAEIVEYLKDKPEGVGSGAIADHFCLGKTVILLRLMCCRVDGSVVMIRRSHNTIYAHIDHASNATAKLNARLAGRFKDSHRRAQQRYAREGAHEFDYLPMTQTVVAAADATPLKLTAARWVFDLGEST